MPWPKVKITILERALFEDICREYGSKRFVEGGGCAPCGRFEDGQEFILDDLAKVPEGFCAWAWSDMHKEILSIATGGDMRPWVKPSGNGDRLLYRRVPSGCVQTGAGRGTVGAKRRTQCRK